MSKPTIILHIGTHKTGTSFLQQMLCNAAAALAEMGILYPAAGRSETDAILRCAHHQLAWYLAGKRQVTTDESWRHLQDELASWSGRSAVISAEGLGTLNSDGIRTVRNYLAPNKVRVLVYLRKPMDFAISTYKQRVKTGTCASTFPHFLSQCRAAVEYGPLVRRWEEVFGPENIELRLYDRVHQDPGLAADFCRAIGADFEVVRPFIPEAINVSPSDPEIRAMRLINRLTWWAGEQTRRSGWPAWLRAQVRRGGIRGGLSRFLLGGGAWRKFGGAEDLAFLRKILTDEHDEFLNQWVAPADRRWLEL